MKRDGPAPAPFAVTGADDLDVWDEKSNILVVDDLPEKLLVFGTVLEDLGQNLVFVNSGSDALREVLNREFAVILLDVNMPDIDGFETAALIRKYKRSAHTPIIFITAYADEIQTAKGYSLGAVDYILSPVVPDVLRSKVKVFVDLHQMQRRVRRQADERVALVAAETARLQAEENDRRSKFLSHASRVLSGSLDVTIGTQLLLELVVPGLASFALLQLMEDGSPLSQVTVGAPGADQLVAVVKTPHGRLPAAMQEALEEAALQKQRVVLSQNHLRRMSSESFGLSGPMLLRSAVAVPLLIGERVLGVLVVGTQQPDSVKAVRDWAALEELASRAAIAFENAHLYRSLQAEIIERRTAEAELQEANQRKDEFLAMLSHELRNPLAPIRNALEVIRRIAPPDPKFTWAGDVMDRQVRHLTRLVEELLDVARISQGKIQLNRESVDLAAVIAQSVETAQPFIDARGHTLTVKLPETPVRLQGDFARLAQVVSNLLHNAAKYSEDGGRIQVELAAQDGEAQIVVRDNGIGIEPALLPRMFDLFAQGTRSLDRMQGGLGVGLTLARRLVELHGGRVEAKSDGPKQGAEFLVTIPCVSVVGHEPQPADAFRTSRPAMGRRILIVDDNQDAAESVAQYLQLEGHEVKTVGDGMQALTCAPVFAPQIVVLDIGLPVLDGYEVAKRMRMLPATKDALLVALTGYGQKEDQQRARDAGFDKHFVKPTDPRLLVELISQWPARPPVAAQDETATAESNGR
ncbi:response regulator [Piscinibacter terrae]|uniref:histidine kinase n=1 Tax=Piscinibacter terrae TaxID=2496871 RepID=A0A3N7HJD4_9BURK|nr:response regulator [Albitalea terrae]RQP22164.1 response regulator [Albitalea terrae]